MFTREFPPKEMSSGICQDEKLQGDQMYNGALDNASGTAALLELAEAFAKLKTPPGRSFLFMSVAVEEKGLAKYHAENPLYPLGELGVLLTTKTDDAKRQRRQPSRLRIVALCAAFDCVK